MILYEVFPYRAWLFGKQRWGVYMMNRAGRSIVDDFATEEEAEASEETPEEATAIEETVEEAIQALIQKAGEE